MMPFAIRKPMTHETIAITACGNLLEIDVTGKLTKEFYETFVPAVEDRIHKFGKVRILFAMREFHGWTAGAFWEDVKFDLKHWRDIDRVAIVGETKWQHGMAIFCAPFTTAKIRYFDHVTIDDARAWLSET